MRSCLRAVPKGQQWNPVTPPHLKLRNTRTVCIQVGSLPDIQHALCSRSFIKLILSASTERRLPPLSYQMEPTKARIRQGFRSLLPVQPKAEIQTQEQSPLFDLPPEIREKIWHFTLLPSKKSAQPHFHIYDEVYDSCLYWSEYKGYKRRPRIPVQMSLLLTCRAIYNEAKLLLYNDTRFTLVILAGNPRGHTNHRHCLGPIKECGQLFSRMKDVTLIVQPGSKRPDAEKYAARIAKLLEAMEYLRHAEKLHLYLNFHVSPFLPSRRACVRQLTHPSQPGRILPVLGSKTALLNNSNRFP